MDSMQTFGSWQIILLESDKVGDDGDVLTRVGEHDAAFLPAAGGGGGDVVGPASAVANTIPLYSGTTGKLIKASLTDPNADRLLFWDDSAGTAAYLTPGTGLSITDTTINAAAQNPFDQDLNTTNDVVFGSVDTIRVGAIDADTGPVISLSPNGSGLLTLNAQNRADDTDGGALNLVAGNATFAGNDGGVAGLFAGTGVRHGGPARVWAGNGDIDGGELELSAGNGIAEDGGNVTIISGSGAVFAGNISLNGGIGNDEGGDVNLNSGAGVVANGNINLGATSGVGVPGNINFDLAGDININGTPGVTDAAIVVDGVTLSFTKGILTGVA